MSRKLEGRDAWLALLATNLAYILLCIPDGSFGILYDPLTYIYHASRTSIGWALSLYWTCIYLAGLLFSPVIDLYGGRVMGFIGGLLYGTGIALSAITTNLPGLFVVYGVMNGLGCGAIYLSFSTVIQQQFTYNRGFANGISSLGFSLGAVLHPLHTLYFMEVFGVSGTFLIHGALAYHIMIFSLALRSPKSCPQNTENKIQTGSAECCDENEREEEIAKSFLENKLSGDNVANHVAEDLSRDRYDERNPADKSDADDNDIALVQMCGSSDNMEVAIPATDQGRGLRRSTELLNSVNHPLTGVEQASLTTHVDNVMSATDLSTQTKKNGGTRTSGRRFISIKASVKNYFKRMLDFSLMTNVVFMLMMLHFLFLWVARLSIMAQIVSCAIHRGVSKDRAAYLLSIAGFGNLFMRIICSVVMNFRWMNPVLFSGLASVMVIASGFMAAFSETYTMFALTMVCMGMSDAIAMANLPQLVVHIIGVSRFPRGIALLWTLLLPGPLGAAPLSGKLVDITGAYFVAFLVIGAEGVISAILAVIVFVLDKRQQSQNEVNNPQVKNTKTNVECDAKVT